jgi:predicted GNAT family acetyltransferase
MSYDFSAVQNKTSKRISAKYKGKNVGYVILKPYKNFMWIQSLYVSQKHRGKGLSHKLLSEALDTFPKSEMRLLVDPV